MDKGSGEAAGRRLSWAAGALLFFGSQICLLVYLFIWTLPTRSANSHLLPAALAIAFGIGAIAIDRSNNKHWRRRAKAIATSIVCALLIATTLKGQIQRIRDRAVLRAQTDIAIAKLKRCATEPQRKYEPWDYNDHWSRVVGSGGDFSYDGRVLRYPFAPPTLT
jgi:branched-subunit amino acid ABC-type transport system permease component